MVGNFQLEQHANEPAVQKFIKHYSTQKYHMYHSTKAAMPYLYHVVEQLDKRGLPGELAMVPMVESGYKPNQVSNKGASGLWQLSSSTGERFGLIVNHKYDGRFDVVAATDSALKYLQYLHDKFNGDWLVALAAYNAGEGRVLRAIAKNKKNGHKTDFWSLPLPKQTKNFVPKILALAYLIKQPLEYGITIQPIANEPYFTSVALHEPMDIKLAADLANLDVNVIKELNPAFKSTVLHPSEIKMLLLPVQHQEIFDRNYRSFAKEFADIRKHIVEAGDSLYHLALKYRTNVPAIKSINNLNSDDIFIGKQLLIPKPLHTASIESSSLVDRS